MNCGTSRWPQGSTGPFLCWQPCAGQWFGFGAVPGMCWGGRKSTAREAPWPGAAHCTWVSTVWTVLARSAGLGNSAEAPWARLPAGVPLFQPLCLQRGDRSWCVRRYDSSQVYVTVASMCLWMETAPYGSHSAGLPVGSACYSVYPPLTIYSALGGLFINYEVYFYI